ncbi:MAG: zinc ABC transporter ATP-binding protein ZnuC [Planctomycetota bacterium]
MKVAVRVRNLEIAFGNRKAIENASFDIPEGGITALIGPNGGGKTSLLKAMLKLVPYSGEITFFPDRGNRSFSVGYIPQYMDIERENPIRVMEFLLLTLQRTPLWLFRRKSLCDRALSALEEVGASSIASSPIGKLSGGEMQRVLLAKVLLDKPDIVLMDEPMSGIDIAGEELFCALIDKMQERMHCTVVIVSHDLSVVQHHATDVICVNRSIRCNGATTSVLTESNLQMLYGPKSGLVKHDDHFKEGHSART